MSTSNSSNQVRLQRPEDWKMWLMQVKMKAVRGGIWKYVNPDLNKDEKPVLPTKPTFPTMPENGDQATIERFNMEYRAYKIKMYHYKILRQEYDEIQESMGELHGCILETVYFGHCSGYIREMSTPADMLVELKKKFRMSPDLEYDLLVKRYRSLLSPKRSTKALVWAEQWRDLVDDYKLAGIKEIESQQTSRDFVAATRNIHPAFYKSWLFRIIKMDILYWKVEESKRERLPPITTMVNIFTNSIEKYGAE